MKFIKIMGSFFYRHFLLVVILILAITLLSIDIDKKFIGQHDWNSVWYGTIARNHIRYGLARTKLGSVSQGGPQDFSNPKLFFTHFPPAFPLFLASGFKLFGQTEVALRLVMIFFSLITVVGIYFLTAKLCNRSIAFMAALFTVISPMFLYYGKLPVHETLILPFIVLAVLFYVYWFETKQKNYFILLLLFLTVAEFITWPVYFLPPLLILHYTFFHKKRTHLPLLVLLLIGEIIVFLTHLLHVKLIAGSFAGGGLLNILTTRLSNTIVTQMYNITIISFLSKEVLYMKIYFTNFICGLALIWIVLFVKKILVKNSLTLSDSIVGLLLIEGIVYTILVHEAAFVHDYLLYYALPFMIMSAAISWYRLMKLINSRNLIGIITLVLILLIANERKLYVKTLLESANSEKGYLIGNFINRTTQFKDRVFIGSNFYNQYFSTFISYYGDRETGYGESITSADLSRYRIIIRPKAHDALDLASKTLLERKYVRYENDQFIWYDVLQTKAL